MGQLIGFSQYSVETGFRGNIDTLVSQRRYDLIGRHGGEFRLVADPQNLVPFLFRKLVAGCSLLGGGLTSIRFALFPPSLQGP
jgi:hypothetical protein